MARFGNFGQIPIDALNYQSWLHRTPAIEERSFHIETIAAIRLEDAIPVSGFVFHMSRCGSTLLANALNRVPGSVVINEPVMLMQCLWCAAETPEAAPMYLALARGLVAAWGARRTGQEKRLFLKLTPFDSFFIPLLRRAFPSVPWVFLFRDPVEVMVSMNRKPFSIDLPVERQAYAAGLSVEDVSQATTLEISARTLGHFCRGAVESAAPGAAFLEYPDLTPSAFASVLAHFRLDPQEPVLLDDVFGRYSKDQEGKAPWVPDSQEKRTAATTDLKEAAERFARGPYNEARALARAGRFSLADPRIS